MENWKKYEMYTDKVRTGILNVNTPIMKKAISLSIAGIIAVTTVTGCSFSTSEQNIVAASEEIIFDNLDAEIETKFNFVEDYLSEITVEQLKNIIFEPYKNARSIEYDLNPENNEYTMFYTDEDINNKKQQIINNLDESIKLIEKYSDRRFAEEYNRSKTK